jgi:hypothetical protein
MSYSNVLFGAVLVAALSALVASQSINVVVVGDLTRTQHRVSGRVYALNESMLILDEFTFDGLGAGVYLNVATQGNSRRQWVQSRTIIDYPSSFDARPIERPYLGERLFIQLPSNILVSDIKWLTVWCEVFGISFGEVQFPNLKGSL